ncbi:zinc ribbon domain-containing protein [Dactylosporangium sp. CA-092794]|uniref:zinc ribbon domain-containing protein n=1 Tax=Dactylosporangium sp. CA-092794 TaxID=3239929 RepID=UPI003D8A8A67
MTSENFQQAQTLLAGRRRRQAPIATVKRTRHPYQLRGLLFCGLCQRRMQGSWNNDKPHYRCVYLAEYGLANHTTHPCSLYLREEQLVPALDRWLLQAFAPHRLPETLAALAAAQDDGRDSEQAARAAEARRVIAECVQRLARYRAALEAGTDPSLVAGWTAEVTATRAAAQARLRDATGAKPTRMTADEIQTIVTSLGNLLTVLRDADPADKAEIYLALGLKLTYQPGQNAVIAEAAPSAIMYEGSCRRGDLNPHP